MTEDIATVKNEKQRRRKATKQLYINLFKSTMFYKSLQIKLQKYEIVFILT